MSKKKPTVKKSTFLDGIAASEHLDSSGERIEIRGIDISSLTIDGVLNYEHKSNEASQIVGKITHAKKIFERKDCENDRQRYFWDKIKTPYLYIIGELFDAVGHQGAKDVAAMLRYDEMNKDRDDKDVKKLINFSIEGQKLEKRGSLIKKCIARKVSITITPCNKMCEAEELKDTKDMEKSDKFTIVQDLMQMQKGEKTSSCQILKAEYVPKRVFESKDAPKDIKVGDRITYPKTKKHPKNVYGEMPKFNAEGRKITTPQTQAKEQSQPSMANVGDPTPPKLKLVPKLPTIKNNMRKAIMASVGMGSPGTQTGNAALTKEDCSDKMQVTCEPKIDLMKEKKKKKIAKKEFQGQNKRPGTFFPGTIEKSKNIVTPAKDMVEEHKHLVQVLESKSHKDDKKEAKKQTKELKEYKEKMNKSEVPDILNFVSKKYPNMNKKEQIALAKTVAVIRKGKNGKEKN